MNCRSCRKPFWSDLCHDCSDEAGELRVALSLAYEQRDTLAEACRAYLAQLDYLQDLWSKEGVTNTIAEKARAALAGLEADA
jgi:hypothetical protein